jgi:hypothetical protein
MQGGSHYARSSAVSLSPYRQIRSHDSPGGIATGYGVNSQWIRVQFLAEARYFSLLHSVHTGHFQPERKHWNFGKPAHQFKVLYCVAILYTTPPQHVAIMRWAHYKKKYSTIQSSHLPTPLHYLHNYSITPSQAISCVCVELSPWSGANITGVVFASYIHTHSCPQSTNRTTEDKGSSVKLVSFESYT